RDHFLLDPDRMSALVMVTDLIKRISAPADVEIVPTGSFVEAQAAGTATVRAPDGSVETLVGDRAELVRFRALQAGHYTVESAGSKVDVYANYYDAEESDLAPLAKPVAWAKAPAPSAAITKEPRVAEPLTIVLVALALFGFMLESALLVRHASRWGMRHV
ncbi:MAG TPA: hypothetical protein VEJ86_01000, partial [Candidatus Binataceae bacterium]|nr:hypothetical protein [Candidatus Binataceae bacterium]